MASLRIPDIRVRGSTEVIEPQRTLESRPGPLKANGTEIHSPIRLGLARNLGPTQAAHALSLGSPLLAVTRQSASCPSERTRQESTTRPLWMSVVVGAQAAKSFARGTDTQSLRLTCTARPAGSDPIDSENTDAAILDRKVRRPRLMRHGGACLLGPQPILRSYSERQPFATPRVARLGRGYATSRRSDPSGVCTFASTA